MEIGGKIFTFSIFRLLDVGVEIQMAEKINSRSVLGTLL